MKKKKKLFEVFLQKVHRVVKISGVLTQKKTSDDKEHFLDSALF